MYELRLSSTKKEEIVAITDKVAAVVAASAVKAGICLVFAPHASATIQSYDAFNEINYILIQ